MKFSLNFYIHVQKTLKLIQYGILKQKIKNIVNTVGITYTYTELFTFYFKEDI